MASKVQIWNLALGHLAQTPVGSDTEETPQAEALARVWDIARLAALSEIPWSFCTVKAELSELASFTPPENWIYGYQYPTNAVRVWKVYDPVLLGGFMSPVSTPPVYPWPDTKKYLKTGSEFRVLYDPTLNKKAVCTNVEDAIGEYTYNLSDVTLYDAAFVDALGYKLAALIAMPMTGDTQVAINMGKLYQNAIAEAKRLSKQENQQGTLGDSGLVDSRG